MFEFVEKIDGMNNTEYYDGTTLRDVYGENYRPEGNKTRFIATRVFLQQVRDAMRRVELITKRIQCRTEAGLDTSDAEQELATAQNVLKLAKVEVAEEISKLCDVSMEMVLTKRYLDAMPWDEVAKTSDIKMRTVMRLHGRALPILQRILHEDGLVELAADEGAANDSADDVAGDSADDEGGIK